MVQEYIIMVQKKTSTKKSVAKRKLTAEPITAKIENPSGRGMGPNPVDVHVGGRLRQRRILLGLTQTELAELLGVTFQQVQKYERGTNRISASRLYDLSRVLEVSIEWFYDNMPEDIENLSPRKRAGLAEAPQVALKSNHMHSREALELVRSYYKIKDNKTRRRIADMCHESAKGTAG